jgi:outer membrane protein assembly factor BamB
MTHWSDPPTPDSSTAELFWDDPPAPEPFWKDAPPAASTMFSAPPRPSDRPPRHWSAKTRRVAVVTVALIAALVVVSIIRSAGRATAESVKRPVVDRPARREPGVIPARWVRTIPDWPAVTVTAPGQDRESIVVADDHVYSLSLRTGALRWTTPMADIDTSGAVAGDTVLVSRDVGFAALERDTGRVRWQVDTSETPSSVALVGAPGPTQVAVVSTREGGLIGLDSHTGATRWSVRLSHTPVGVFAVDQESGLVAIIWIGDITGATLRVIDGATGVVRWEQKVAPMTSAPGISDGMVLIGAGSSPTASDVSAFALADGAPRWKTHVDAPFQPDLVPLVDDGEVFVVDQLGGTTRLNLQTGEKRWATLTKALSVYTQPIRVDDAILISNENGEVITLDRESGEVRARRRPAGLPVGMIATGRSVVIVQRLVRRDAIQAFAAKRLTAPARSAG